MTENKRFYQMNLVKIPILVGFKSFHKIRFQEIDLSFPAKSSSPSGELSCPRRRKFPGSGRWRRYLFDQRPVIVSPVISDKSAHHTNKCSISLERQEPSSTSSCDSICERLKLCINGLESALNSQSKWLIATFFVGLLLWRRNGAASWAAIGSAINVGLSNTLKKMLNQERPVSHLKRSDPGMPSSHAQSIFYTSTFAIISMVQYQGFNGFTKLLLSPLIFAFGVYLSWLRVSHQFHTIDQVKVGAAIGTAFSILWFWSWDAYVLNVVITYSWVRNVVALGAVGYCLGFIVSVSQNFLKDGLT